MAEFSKVCTMCEEELPVTHFSKHKAGKLGLNPRCKSCHSRVSREWRKNNPSKSRSCSLAYREKNRESERSRSSKWSKSNRDKRNAQDAKRRALKLNQTPPLTAHEKELIDNLYWLAKDLRAVSGQDYHVDHIIPLAKGGLHHPDNLQILPADINLQKGDRI